MPSANWWIQACRFSRVQMLSKVAFDYRSVQRRCILTTAQGPKTYSLSLQGGRNKGQSFETVLLDWTQPSMHDLPAALTTNYARTPFFEDLFPEFLGIWNQQPKYLWCLNLSLLVWAQKRLGLGIDFFQEPAPASLPLLDLTSELPSEFTYRQMFDEQIGFVPEAGSFDLLFNLGPEFRYWLQEARTDLQ